MTNRELLLQAKPASAQLDMNMIVMARSAAPLKTGLIALDTQQLRKKEFHEFTSILPPAKATKDRYDPERGGGKRQTDNENHQHAPLEHNRHQPAQTANLRERGQQARQRDAPETSNLTGSGPPTRLQGMRPAFAPLVAGALNHFGRIVRH